MIKHSLEILLILSCTAGIVLCIRVIRRSQLKSLLAWHSLCFLAVTTPAVITISYSELPIGFIVRKSEEITVKFILATILINFIILMYVSFEKKLYLRMGLDSQWEKAKLVYFERFKLKHLILFILIVVGIFVFFSFEATQYVLTNIGDMFLERDYANYYAIRTEQLYLGKSNLEIHFEIIALVVTLPLFNLYALFNWESGRDRLWFIFWLMSLVIWVLYGVLTLQKGPLFAIAISNIIIKLSMQKKKGRSHLLLTRRSKFYVYALSVVLVVYAVYYYSGYEGNVILELFDRVFVVTGYGAYVNYLIFPDIHPYLYYYGSTTMNLLLGLGQDTSFSTRYTSPAFIVSLLSSGSTYSMNSSILGDGWANYGFLGVFQCALILFGLLVFWDVYLKKRKSNLPLVPLVAFFLGRSYQISNGDLMFMMTKGGLVLAPLIYIYLARGGIYYFHWGSKD